jgi:phenylacetic acid degradation operon negative regulatory protein
MNQMSKLDAFIQQAVDAMPISGTSLIASLYGDLLQRGGEVWLGSVAALLEGLGFGERFVRTALFRLNKEEWLDVVRIGRRSFYRLSDKGLRLTRRAEHKIYRASAPNGTVPGCCCCRKAGEKHWRKSKNSCCGRDLARWRRACWPRRRKSWRMQSLLHEAGVAENVICFEAHSRWRSPGRRCALALKSAGISPNRTRCMNRLSPCFDRCCRCFATASPRS